MSSAPRWMDKEFGRLLREHSERQQMLLRRFHAEMDLLHINLHPDLHEVDEHLDDYYPEATQ